MTSNAEDVLEHLRAITPRDWKASVPIVFRSDEPEVADHEPPETDRARLINALGPAPVDIDTLIRETGLQPAFVNVILLELELAGRIERLRGNRISLLS